MVACRRACVNEKTGRNRPVPICGAKGTPASCWNSAIFSAFRNCGYLVGYLTGPFPTCPFGLPLRRMPTVRPARSLPHCSFLCGGGEGVPPHYAGLSCVRSTGAGHRAKRWTVAVLPFSRLFYILFLFFFLDFLHFRHIHVFTCDTPGFLRFFGFFCSVFGVCDTPWFWLVFNVSRLFCVDGSSITQCMIY